MARLTQNEELALEEIADVVEAEYEGYVDYEEELVELVNELAEDFMERLDCDINTSLIYKEIVKNVEFARGIEHICTECGDPDCEGCY